MSDRQHVAPEGELPWAHRLGPAQLVDRVTKLVDLSAGLRVAHVGFADAGCESSHPAEGDWLHAKLARSARQLVGLDISLPAVEAGRRDGYEVYAVDCTSPRAVAGLGLAPFDLVVAGEVIEHLEAPGPFLAAMHDLTGVEGQLVLTTPNAFRPQNVLLALARREWVHPDHVLAFSPRTLSVLLERNGWQVQEFLNYLNPVRPRAGYVSPGVTLVGAATLVQRFAARHVSPYVADGFVVTVMPTPGRKPSEG